MYRPSFTFWYCVFLLVIQSSGKNKMYLENFTNGDEWSDDSTIPYEFNTNSMKNQDNETELMPYNSLENSMKNKSETNFILQELNGHSNKTDDNNIVPYKMCNNTCLLHCCNLIVDNCNLEKFVDYILKNPDLGKVWKAAIAYSCEVNDILLDNENTMFSDNSSLKLSRHERLISLFSKCADILLHSDITTCLDKKIQKISIYIDCLTAVLIISMLCLLMTFIVYSICPELQNMQGYTLRSYVASLFVVFTIRLTVYRGYLIPEYPVCVAESLLILFCQFARFLWQNVICFDILRTFRRVRVLRKNVKQSKRKIFLMSSFYVWGIASMYVIICAVINFVPTVPDNIQPKICINKKLEFANENAKLIYVTIPMCVLYFCTICFLIFTILRIVHATKNDDSFQKDAEDKQRSMMYLKLLLYTDINLGLLKIIQITSPIIINSYEILAYVLYYLIFVFEGTEFVQSLIIFIIFVCKKRIMQLLLKRFGYEKLFVKREK